MIASDESLKACYLRPIIVTTGWTPLYYRKGKSKGLTALDLVKKYNKYWKRDDRDDDIDGDKSNEGAVYRGVMRRTRKQRFKALENINDTIKEQIEFDVKKVLPFD